VAQSVAFVVDGTTYTVSAKREIILSAGVFQSPQLLELSGIGNATLLKSLGILPLIDLPGVGENLQDHPASSQMFQVRPGLVTWDQLRINQTFAAAAATQ
jgi:choline dehydrogenase-like flavoprotein